MVAMRCKLRECDLPCAMHLSRSLRFNLALSTLPYGRDSFLHTHHMLHSLSSRHTEEMSCF